MPSISLRKIIGVFVVLFLLSRSRQIWALIEKSGFGQIIKDCMDLLSMAPNPVKVFFVGVFFLMSFTLLWRLLK